MKKVIKILCCTIILLSIVGCGNKDNIEKNDKEEVKLDMKKVSLYKSSDIMGTKESDTPFLVIENEDGLKLFSELIDNAKKMDGILDMTTPPYIAEVQYSDKNEVLYFNIHTSSGMFVNSKDTGTGYNFELEDIEAFINIYEEYFDLGQ
jgi:uncharacterized lipoprotein YehR (DUF1307 family)